MFRFVGITIAIVFGAIIGILAAKLFNKGRSTLNPRIYTIVGVIGGGLGGYLAGTFGGGGFKTTLLQIAAGVACSVFLLLFLLLVRGRKDPFDEDYNN